MPKKPNAKLKMLYLKDMLERRTDAEHGITVAEIMRLLEGQSIEVNRKTIYDDMEELALYGLDIEHPEHAKDYRLLSRDFDLAEIKLMIDSISSSKFLTVEQTRTLIKKLEKLCSDYEAKQLHRQVIVAGRVKSLNTGVHNNVDYVNAAIEDNKQISFKYFDYNLRKQRAYRKKGERYVISPFALVYSDENYYFLGFDAEKQEIRPFRVDRMENVAVEALDRVGQETFDKIKIEDYQKYSFSMFCGEREAVTMVFQNRMMNAVIDRFGSDIHARKVDNNHFEITVSVAVSQQFFGWVFGLGKMVRITAPESVKEQMKKALMDIVERYE